MTNNKKEEKTIADKKAELIVENYLTDHDYEPKRINTKKLKSGVKSPDFCVKENGSLVFHCEVKNPLLLVNDATKMFHWTTSVSKLRRFIKKAREQFDDADKNHSTPRIIAFTSAHFQFCWINFIDAYLGKVIRNKLIISDLSKEKYVANSQKDIDLVDAFLWFQVNPKNEKIYQLIMLINKNSIFKEETRKILNKLEPFDKEEIIDMNGKKNYIITL